MAGKDDYEGLSEEERLALEDDEDTADTKALKAVAGDTDDDDVDDGTDADTKAEGDEAKAADAKTDDDDAGADAKADDDAEEELDAGDVSPFAPHMDATPPENYEDRKTELSTAESDLDEKFEGNEIGYKEYRTEQRRILGELQELERAKDKADFAAQYNDSIDRQRWQWEIDRFMDDVKRDGGVDYRVDEASRKQLDMAVRMVASSDDGGSMTGRQILQEAHDWASTRSGTGKKATDTKGEGDAVGKKKPTGRKPDLRSVPTTLSEVPAGDVAEVSESNSKFDQLDKLADNDGLAYERALAKLSKEEQAAYAQHSVG